MNGVPVASTIYAGKDATILRYGLLDDVPHNRLMHGAIIAQTEDGGASHRVLKAAGHTFILVVNCLKVFTGKRHASTVNWSTVSVECWS